MQPYMAVYMAVALAINIQLSTDGFGPRISHTVVRYVTTTTIIIIATIVYHSIVIYLLNADFTVSFLHPQQPQKTTIFDRELTATVSFLHPQQPHKTTIFDRELTADNYRNILDI